MFPNDSIQTYSLWSVQDDRDRSRTAAERYFLLDAAADQRPSPARRSWLRRLPAAVLPSAVIRRRAEA
jgi:hypothetical protein